MPGDTVSPSSVGRRALLGAAGLGAGLVLSATTTVAQAPSATGKKRNVPAPSKADGGISNTIAAHVVGTRYEDLGQETVAKAKLRLLDLAGCAIGGMRGEGAAAFARLTAARGGRPDATLFGTGARVPASEAAMANATLARIFDFEVMHVVAQGVQVPSHHSPTTVMTSLAMAERTHADGQSFLTALSVGDDLAARTLAAAGIDFDDGWDGAPLHSTMAAAAIAARFLKLDALAARQAMGLSADQIGGTVQAIWDGGNAWKAVQGTAARNGIICAELAGVGWSGMADPLLGPRAFYAQFTPGCARPELLTAGLGREWFAETYFKPYPACAASHPTIQCALELRKRKVLNPSNIRAVRLMLAPHVLGLFISKPFLNGPSLHSQANFNVAFACANALLRGSFRQEHYLPEVIGEPALRAMLNKVALTPLPEGTEGVVIEVTMVDGAVQREALAGHPRQYVDQGGTTAQQVEAKFRQQVAFAGTVPPGVADELVLRISTIEREHDMAAFAALLGRATNFYEGSA